MEADFVMEDLTSWSTAASAPLKQNTAVDVKFINLQLYLL